MTFALCWKGTQCIDLSHFPQVFRSFYMNSLTNNLNYLLLHLCHCHHHWQWSPAPVSISQSPPPAPLSSSPDISSSPHPHTSLTVTGSDSSTPTRDERIIIKEGGTVICVHNIRFDNVEIIHVKKRIRSIIEQVEGFSQQELEYQLLHRLLQYTQRAKYHIMMLCNSS